jgi:hypothetical protein
MSNRISGGFWKALFNVAKAIASVAFPVEYKAAQVVYNAFRDDHNALQELQNAGVPLCKGRACVSQRMTAEGATVLPLSPEDSNDDEVFYKILMEQLTPAQRAFVEREAAQQLGVAVSQVQQTSKEVAPPKTNWKPWAISAGVVALFFILSGNKK